MRKINKRKITIIILLIIMLIIEILAFSFSRAEKVKEIQVSIKDTSGNLEIQTIELNATDSGESGYYITLPEEVGNKQIISYTFDTKNSNTNDTNKTENSIQNEEEKTEADNKNTAVENNNEVKITSKKPGDKVYLTEAELENAKISLNAKFDTKEKDGDLLYNTKITEVIENNQVTVKGYMPQNATLSVEVKTEDDIKEQLKDYINKSVSLKVAYDIKIVSDGKKYEPNTLDEDIQVTILGIDSIDDNNQKYKIIHIDENNKTEEIKKTEINGNSILFNTNTFSIYAVLLDETMSLANIATYARTAAVLSAEKSTWDGTVTTGFKYGDGTQANPYLITNAKELAYLRDQVNNGTTYENTFFQLTTDIDLNSMVWMPIGNNTNSFRGTFDGAGHIISNIQITISALATSVTSYGFFGSVGGGNSTCTIKNVEFDSIQISITARGTTRNNNTTKGYHIGIVAGTVYKNTAIVNNIVKNCTIDDTNTITIRNSSYQFAVGGIAGYVSNTSSSETDPGAGQRYSIENCFADVEIAIDATLRNNTLSNAGQYAIGGIVGIIRSQPVWPSNCLYVGSINGNGFIGPIFGYLRNSTAYTSTYNFATLWNGNDAGNLTMDSYFNSYSAKGTYFTQSVTSGTSNQRRSNTTNNIGYVQGVNKGIYQSDISTMLSTFNNYAGSDYLKWKYTNGTFSFIKRFNTSIDDSNAPTYKVITDNQYSSNLTYKWYINDVIDESLTGDSITKEMSWESEYNIEVLVYDGKYYSVAAFAIPRLTIEIEFDIDNNNDKVTARLTRNSLTLC